MNKVPCKVEKDRHNPWIWVVTFPSGHAPLTLGGPFMMLVFLKVGCGITVEVSEIQNFDPAIISECDIDALDKWKP